MSLTRFSPDTKTEDNKVMCNDDQEFIVWICQSSFLFPTILLALLLNQDWLKHA